MRPSANFNHNGSYAKVWQGDALKIWAGLKPCSVSLIVSSPPYFMGKEYDKSDSLKDFIDQHKKIFPLLIRSLKPGGSICWQVGHHVRKNVAIPLDAVVYSIAAEHADLILRNRIIWTFNHGAHSPRRFSGRHESILWFTKGDDYTFNLDAVRTPQKYPGKRHYKGPRKGQYSGNPLGKNPGDVWDIPNVKAKHIEKTDHPCQFPLALATRLIKGLTNQGDLVADPFLGSGTSCLASLLEGRNFVGSEIKQKYVAIVKRRLRALQTGNVKVRPDIPVRLPNRSEAVSIAPAHFFAANFGGYNG